MMNNTKKIEHPYKTQSLGHQKGPYRPVGASSKPHDVPSHQAVDRTMLGQASIIATNRGYGEGAMSSGYQQYLYKRMQYSQQKAIGKTVNAPPNTKNNALQRYYGNLARVFNVRQYQRYYGLQDNGDDNMYEKRLPHLMEVGDIVFNSTMGIIGVLQDKEIHGDDTVLIFQDRRFPVKSFDHSWGVTKYNEENGPMEEDLADDAVAPVASSSAQGPALFKEQVDSSVKQNFVKDTVQKIKDEVNSQDYPPPFKVKAPCVKIGEQIICKDVRKEFSDHNEEMKMGIKVEKEHKATIDWIKKYYKDNGKFPPDEEVYGKIAQNHLDEFKTYYTHLKKMEDDLKKDKTETSDMVETAELPPEKMTASQKARQAAGTFDPAAYTPTGTARGSPWTPATQNIHNQLPQGALQAHAQQHNLGPGSMMHITSPSGQKGVYTVGQKGNISPVSSEHPLSHYENMFAGFKNRHALKTDKGEFTIHHVTPEEIPKKTGETAIKYATPEQDKAAFEALHKTHLDNMNEYIRKNMGKPQARQKIEQYKEAISLHKYYDENIAHLEQPSAFHIRKPGSYSGEEAFTKGPMGSRGEPGIKPFGTMETFKEALKEGVETGRIGMGPGVTFKTQRQADAWAKGMKTGGTETRAFQRSTEKTSLVPKDVDVPKEVATSLHRGIEHKTMNRMQGVIRLHDEKGEALKHSVPISYSETDPLNSPKVALAKAHMKAAKHNIPFRYSSEIRGNFANVGTAEPDEAYQSVLQRGKERQIKGYEKGIEKLEEQKATFEKVKSFAKEQITPTSVAVSKQKSFGAPKVPSESQKEAQEFVSKMTKTIGAAEQERVGISQMLAKRTPHIVTGFGVSSKGVSAEPKRFAGTKTPMEAPLRTKIGVGLGSMSAQQQINLGRSNVAEKTPGQKLQERRLEIREHTGLRRKSVGLNKKETAPDEGKAEAQLPTELIVKAKEAESKKEKK